MGKSIMIPLSLFGRIVELTDDLRDSSYGYHLCAEYGDVLGGLEMKLKKIELRKAYAQVMAARDDEARVRARIEYLRQKRRARIICTPLRGFLMAYEAEIGDITRQERAELHKWVSDGHSPYDNPCLLYGENGRLLDFITAIRIDGDMMRNPQDYFSGPDLETGIDAAEEDLPF